MVFQAFSNTTHSKQNNRFESALDKQFQEELKAATQKGYQEGFEEGEKAGYDKGLSDGKKEGYDEGYQAATAEWNAAQQQKEDEALQQVEAAIKAIADHLPEAEEKVKHFAAVGLEAALSATLPFYVQRHGTDEATAFLEQAFKSLTLEPAVTLYTPLELGEAYQARIEEMWSNAAPKGQLTFKTDPDGPAVKLDWGQGSATKQIESIQHNILTLLKERCHNE